MGVGHAFLEIFGLERVQDIEKVFPWRAFILRVDVREILHHLLILLELGVELLDRQLIVMWDLDLFHLGLLEQLLPPSKDLLEKIFVDISLWR